ncbi:MAG: hypothetical protein KF886_00995 [Candidatus Hydrogenedentes bacterium]|nr:hypothetical protein [Candidatus Hydrogenedentota bacterium]
MSETGMIPDFDPHGLLLDGVYVCDEGVFKEKFVDAFPNSSQRRVLFDGFKKLRDEAEVVLSAATQWVDGSYVTDKADPDDVDVVTFVEIDLLNALFIDQQNVVRQLLHGREDTKEKYGCHTFLVPCCDPSNRFFGVFERQRLYWRKWFGSTRGTVAPNGTPGPGREKGFVSLVLGDASIAPSVSAKRTTP